MSEAIEDLKELVDFLVGQGHSPERAQQIAGNHPDAVRADMEKADESSVPAGTPPDLIAIRDYLHEQVEAIEGRYDRLTDHVNREIGVAQDVPLVERLRSLEVRIAEMEKANAEKEKAPKEESGAAETAKPDLPA